jgi:hypothetical protein
VDSITLFIILAVIYGIVALFKRLGQQGQGQQGQGQQGQEQQGQEEPEEPAQPARSGLDDIRRFLEEISGGPGEGVPPTRRASVEPRPQAPAAPTPRPAGRPPTRRPVSAGAPSAPPPGPRPAAARPAAAPRVVTAQSIAAAATPARPLAGRLSEAKVKETLRAGEVSTKAESLAKQAERLAARAPRKPVSVAPAAYRAAARAPASARGLLEAVQRLQQPLARAILYQEIIGLPLAIRGPERTFTDRVP